MAISQPIAGVEVADQQILSAWRDGDKIALEILYRWYADRLRQFCQRRLGNSAEAEDATHESILKAYKALPNFDDGARIWPWLATIASNVCTDMQRRHKYSAPADLAQAGSEDFQEVIDSRVRAEIVNAALTELPRKYRTLVYLKDYTGLSYEQIAQRLDTSVASVRSTLLRARSSLRVLIRRAAEQRGHWPLPVVIPSGSLLKYPSGLWRRTQGIRNELAAWWLRMANLLDASAVVGLANAVAVVALIVSASQSVEGSTPAAATQQRLTVGTSLDVPLHPRAATPVSSSRKSQARYVYEADSPRAGADLDEDGKGTWVDVGPVRVNCDSDSRHATVSRIAAEALCPYLDDRSAPIKG